MGTNDQELIEAAPPDYDVAVPEDYEDVVDFENQPPEWTPSPVSSKELMSRVPGSVRMEGPQINELINIMLLLPEKQKEDPKLRPIWEHLRENEEQLLTDEQDGIHFKVPLRRLPIKTERDKRVLSFQNRYINPL